MTTPIRRYGFRPARRSNAGRGFISRALPQRDDHDVGDFRLAAIIFQSRLLECLGDAGCRPRRVIRASFEACTHKSLVGCRKRPCGCALGPARVADHIIAEIRSRERDGLVELPQRKLVLGDRVRVTTGPLRGFDGSTPACERASGCWCCWRCWARSGACSCPRTTSSGRDEFVGARECGRRCGRNGAI
jgi:hypothetical protein